MKLRLIYREKVDRRSKTSSHYQLIDGNSLGLLSTYIRISANRGFAKNSQPDFWLHEHNGKRFNKMATTGLFKTPLKDEVYSGDLNYKTHQILVQRKQECVIITIMVNNYPYSKSLHPRNVAKLVRIE
ncbi:hypothetical protein SAMN04488116_2700 [Flagellimonas flava]|uniref:Uncharacterized protein n=1 Tax=Flagellimonas flava TaxID=570519 RepID=A0A1M5N7L4_9FLAO|nr:hypothetical protein SAMN04488116_2700 [Allomuricauda flava]